MMEINCGKHRRVHVTRELLDGNRRWENVDFFFTLQSPVVAYFVIMNDASTSLKRAKIVPACWIIAHDFFGQLGSLIIPHTITIIQHVQVDVSWSGIPWIFHSYANARKPFSSAIEISYFFECGTRQSDTNSIEDCELRHATLKIWTNTWRIAIVRPCVRKN